MHAMARECPWCSTPASDEATSCGSCGAALAQRESIGDLVIPGVTTVDPALQALDAQPIRPRGPSPSQGVASGIIVAAAAGGPIGLAALGGIAAVAAVEYAGATRRPGGEPVDLEAVGRPSEAVLQALERLEDEPAAASSVEEPAASATVEPGSSAPEPGAPAPAEPVHDPWRDLPPLPPSVDEP